MNAKRIIIIGTMAFAISIGGGIWSGKASTAPLDKSDTAKFKADDRSGSPIAIVEPADFHEVLGAASNEEVYDALYNGKTLADIAAGNDADVGDVIALQIGELTEQLSERLRSGSLSYEDYLAQKEELPDIVRRSAFGNTGRLPDV